MAAFKVGIVGLGKIALDQHVPVIAKSPDFEVAAVASQRGAGLDGVPVFRTQAEMLAAVPDLDAVAICTPPLVRPGLAREALAAGKHVLLEKPPAATLNELADLVAFAQGEGRVLFATWHSQHNAAVEKAREALRGETLAMLGVNWKEDVRRWHPGQAWIWQAGGFGVFDPGINALSILTRIAPQTLFVRAAELVMPANRDAPIAATLTLATAATEDGLKVELDWRQEGEQHWDIELKTKSGRHLHLAAGGTRLEIDGKLVVEAPMQEYEGIYERFAELLRSGLSEVDPQPLRLVADAFMVGRRVATEPFED